MSFFPTGGANSALTKALAGFEGHFEGRKKKGKGKEGREKKRKERAEEMGENTPEMNFWLRLCF